MERKTEWYMENGDVVAFNSTTICVCHKILTVFCWLTKSSHCDSFVLSFFVGMDRGLGGLDDIEDTRGNRLNIWVETILNERVFKWDNHYYFTFDLGEYDFGGMNLNTAVKTIIKTQPHIFPDIIEGLADMIRWGLKRSRLVKGN